MTVPGNATVTIPNLPAFLAAIAVSVAQLPSRTDDAIQAAGQLPLARTRSRAPVRTGRLQSSYFLDVSHGSGQFLSSAPYSAGAEVGTQGKWKGFGKYGTPPRFAARSMDESSAEMEKTMTGVLADIFTIKGWARP